MIENIGKYKIIKLLGEGGMASVYEAEHEMLGTKVAIKILNPLLSSNQQIRERFKNEAKLMAALNHPNITKVIDFDEHNQNLCIIMELLEGEDLNEKIKKDGALSEEQIESIFSQTLSAFQFAHEKGIMHRDIKPSNIFILTNGQVKILDFGIAKLFGQGDEMTQTGTQIGTPIYMSPEQVKSDKSIDYRSDIYSLGVTMYYAINGNTPYNSTTDSQFDIFTKIVYEPLPDFTIQTNLNTLVLKACQKNREDRFQSCEDWAIAMNKMKSITDYKDQSVSTSSNKNEEFPKDNHQNNSDKPEKIKELALTIEKTNKVDFPNLKSILSKEQIQFEHLPFWIWVQTALIILYTSFYSYFIYRADIQIIMHYSNSKVLADAYITKAGLAGVIFIGLNSYMVIQLFKKLVQLGLDNWMLIFRKSLNISILAWSVLMIFFSWSLDFHYYPLSTITYLFIAFEVAINIYLLVKIQQKSENSINSSK